MISRNLRVLVTVENSQEHKNNSSRAKAQYCHGLKVGAESADPKKKKKTFLRGLRLLIANELRRGLGPGLLKKEPPESCPLK